MEISIISLNTIYIANEYLYMGIEVTLFLQTNIDKQNYIFLNYVYTRISYLHGGLHVARSCRQYFQFNVVNGS